MKNGVAYKKNRVAQKCTYLFSVDLKMCCSLVIIAKKINFISKKIERLQYSTFFVEAIASQGDISFRKLCVKNGFRETSDGYFIN